MFPGAGSARWGTRAPKRTSPVELQVRMVVLGCDSDKPGALDRSPGGGCSTSSPPMPLPGRRGPQVSWGNSRRVRLGKSTVVRAKPQHPPRPHRGEGSQEGQMSLGHSQGPRPTPGQRPSEWPEGCWTRRQVPLNLWVALGSHHASSGLNPPHARRRGGRPVLPRVWPPQAVLRGDSQLPFPPASPPLKSLQRVRSWACCLLVA